MTSLLTGISLYYENIMNMSRVANPSNQSPMPLDRALDILVDLEEGAEANLQLWRRLSSVLRRRTQDCRFSIRIWETGSKTSHTAHVLNKQRTKIHINQLFLFDLSATGLHRMDSSLRTVV